MQQKPNAGSLRDVALATLNLMLFRSGPQDFPFDPGLTRVLVPLTVLAVYVVQVVVMPAVLAAVTALATVIGLALAAQAVLRARKLEGRFTQTYHALLAVTAVMTLMLWPLLRNLAPVLLQVSDSMGDPTKAGAVNVPTGQVFLLLALFLWNFAVNASIFRHAADISPWRGVVVTLMVAMGLQVFAMLFVMVAGALTGTTTPS